LYGLHRETRQQLFECLADGLFRVRAGQGVAGREQGKRREKQLDYQSFHSVSIW
jgi:hypothetical protein